MSITISESKFRKVHVCTTTMSAWIKCKPNPDKEDLEVSSNVSIDKALASLEKHMKWKRGRYEEKQYDLIEFSPIKCETRDEEYMDLYF